MPLNRINPKAYLAPALSAALLLGVLGLDLVGAEDVPGVERFHDRVALAVERIPYKIGTWVGRDVPVAAAAGQLLQPVKLLQRRYTDPQTGRAFNLLLVYCGDSRDMQGHYPPNCYPAHGWTQRRVDETTVEIGGSRVPARQYEFARLSDGVEQHTVILNFFMLPAAPTSIVGDIGALNRAARSRSVTALGAGQIQILTDSRLTEAERRQITESVLETLEPTIRVITGGMSDEQPA